jgi:hypothetical protein
MLGTWRKSPSAYSSRRPVTYPSYAELSQVHSLLHKGGRTEFAARADSTSHDYALGDTPDTVTTQA